MYKFRSRVVATEEHGNLAIRWGKAREFTVFAKDIKEAHEKIRIVMGSAGPGKKWAIATDSVDEVVAWNGSDDCWCGGEK